MQDMPVDGEAGQFWLDMDSLQAMPTMQAVAEMAKMARIACAALSPVQRPDLDEPFPEWAKTREAPELLGLLVWYITAMPPGEAQPSPTK